MNTRTGKCCSVETVLWNLLKPVILCSRINIIIIFYIKRELVWNPFISLVREILVTCHLLFGSWYYNSKLYSPVKIPVIILAFAWWFSFLGFYFNADSRILSFRNLLTVHTNMKILSSFEFLSSVNINRDILRNLLVTFIESNCNEWEFEFLSFKKNTKAKNNILYPLH